MPNQTNAASAAPTVSERVFRPIAAGQPSADPEHTRATEVCWLHPDVRMALQGVVADFLRLASMAADMHFLQTAQGWAADSSPDAVVVALNAIRQNLQGERDAVRDELASWNSGHAAARLNTRNHELAADDARREADNRVKSLRGRLRTAPEEQARARAKLQAAGLSEADIAKVGLRPSAEEIAAWEAEAEVLGVQIQRIDRFFAGRPHFDPSILDDADLVTLDSWQQRLPHTGALGYRAS